MELRAQIHHEAVSLLQRSEQKVISYLILFSNLASLISLIKKINLQKNQNKRAINGFLELRKIHF